MICIECKIGEAGPPPPDFIKEGIIEVEHCPPCLEAIMEGNPTRKEQALINDFEAKGGMELFDDDEDLVVKP